MKKLTINSIDDTSIEIIYEYAGITDTGTFPKIYWAYATSDLNVRIMDRFGNERYVIDLDNLNVNGSTYSNIQDAVIAVNSAFSF